MNREGLMLSRSERYLEKAEKCQQISDAADISGTKRLYGVMASQWRQLADEADEADKKPLLEKIRLIANEVVINEEEAPVSNSIVNT
jgi:hypothetical protein